MKSSSPSNRTLRRQDTDLHHLFLNWEIALKTEISSSRSSPFISLPKLVSSSSAKSCASARRRPIRLSKVAKRSKASDNEESTEMSLIIVGMLPHTVL
ncbi:hypothetical protein GIB67_020991 [Kingdonia uniflora]|uniref:Uncharacterized protein n=1 Tax=Kingdonia uniflora TaxID=39325 RepID=A0A7J7N442_9MAGN|nr:hypothetical protein GIB67_020991 [Kingdonia uniflora]